MGLVGESTHHACSRIITWTHTQRQLHWNTLPPTTPVSRRPVTDALKECGFDDDQASRMTG